MLHGSEICPVRKANVVSLQRAEMRMVTWMCGIKLKDRFPSKELRERERVAIDDIALVLQQNRLRCYGHVLQKKMVIGRRKAWSMRLRVQDQEEDLRGPGERLSERTVKHVN